ncbi:MAG: tRNA pseudouridine(55) synthase TruB [Campylobacterales bacterium]
MEERLFVGYKPPFISSNRYLHQLKQKYRVRKGGFSGTLDPFGEGVLIIAFGRYTKLFRFLKKSPKLYRATLLLGGVSRSLDIEQVERIDLVPRYSREEVERVFSQFPRRYLQTPPLYSAKKVGGKRAYQLAQQGEEVELKTVPVEIFQLRLVNYSHPFLTFEAEVSEGCFIRSLGADLAARLGTTGFLTTLTRLREGKFEYRCEEPLDPTQFLNCPKNRYLGPINQLQLGRKISIEELETQQDGVYWVKGEGFFSILEVKNRQVHYLLNNLPLQTSPHFC